MSDQVTVSPELAKFYRWYIKEVVNFADSRWKEELSRDGLCMLLQTYCRSKRIKPASLVEEQEELFMRLYLTSTFPFCTSLEFLEDMACHTHPKRLAHAHRFAYRS